VYASKGKWKNYWEIKSVVDHTCVLEQLDTSHHNLSSGFVASQMFAKIVENPAFEPVGDSPEGPLKQPGESCLKPAKNRNKTSLT
jgi:hypothetical protein